MRKIDYAMESRWFKLDFVNTSYRPKYLSPSGGVNGEGQTKKQKERKLFNHLQ